jgi:hypothetical protein
MNIILSHFEGFNMINLNKLKKEIAKKKNKDGKEKYKNYLFFSSSDRKSDSDSSSGLNIEAKKGRCWEGYEATPGKKPYSPGSCRKKKEKNSVKKEKKASLNLRSLRKKII